MPGFPAPAPTRFWMKVDKSEGCWLWTASRTGPGYGQFWDGAKIALAHRYSYELHKGPIPEGLTLDHLCRVRHCVNPDHLEAVTMRENLLRGTSPGAKAARATHCPNGHPYDDANTYRFKAGHRICKACANQRSRTGYRNRRARGLPK